MTLADKSKAITEMTKTLAHQITYIQEHGQEMAYEDLVALYEASSEVSKEMVEMWKRSFKSSVVPCQC